CNPVLASKRTWTSTDVVAARGGSNTVAAPGTPGNPIASRNTMTPSVTVMVPLASASHVSTVHVAARPPAARRIWTPSTTDADAPPPATAPTGWDTQRTRAARASVRIARPSPARVASSRDDAVAERKIVPVPNGGGLCDQGGRATVFFLT